MTPSAQSLNVCSLNALGFVECATGHYKITGSTLTAGTFDFSPVITDLFWALGFSSLGNSFPFVTNIEQVYFFSNLQVYPSTLPQLSATEVQFNDQYETPSGLVQTMWTVNFNHSAKLITISDLMTKLPGQSAFRACAEILLNFWRLDSFSYPVPPAEIILPYK